MKISTKGRYGLRAMVDLAIISRGDHVSLSSIAERQDVSVNYLEQVFSILRKSGLVNSVKGAQGGYMLADTPSNITVGKILRALEGELSVASESNGDERVPQGIEYCIEQHVWKKMNQCINGLVDSMTLEDLILEYNKINENISGMYYI